MIIRPVKRLAGKLRLPGDKSISHRAALLAALADGTTRIANFAASADCAATLNCLENLGVKIERDGTNVTIHGVGKTGFVAPTAPLDCQNSGTTMRLLAGILAGQNFTSVLTGDESLRKRPMTRVIKPLEQMGARIESTDGRAPLIIHGKNPLDAIVYELPVASAQVKSCVLLAGINGNGRTEVLENHRFNGLRDHTELMLRWLGVDVEENRIKIETEHFERISIDNNAQLFARDILIPGDMSSAAFFMAAAVCLPGSNLLLENIGLNFTRATFLSILQATTSAVEFENRREVCNEDVGDIQIQGNQIEPSKMGEFMLAPEAVAGTIDEIPILAVIGTQIFDGLVVRGAKELRVKESDRIAAVVENLRRMNARVEEFDDGFRVEKSELIGARVDSFGDHRIAMAFAVAALFAKGDTEIVGAEAVDVSFPGFFDVLKSVCE